MKAPRRIATALWVAALWAVPLNAQVQDTLGTVDTLIFGDVSIAPGRHVKVPLVVVNDVEYYAVTIPVAFAADHLNADSVSFVGGRLAHFASVHSIDQDRGRILLGAVQVGGPTLAPGRGEVAWLHFTVADQAPLGATIAIDTGYFSDAGVLNFIGGPGGETAFQPAVEPGAVHVVPPNRPPVFAPAGKHVVREGDSLTFGLAASDPDGDAIRLTLLHPPVGARFTDLGNGQGRLSWRAPFTGPYSASGGPMRLVFAADDGEDVTRCAVPVSLVNVNRPPVLTLPDTLWSEAFDSLVWSVAAQDPDLDFVVLTVTGVPQPAGVQLGNPLEIRWRPTQADTGTYPVRFYADDQNGGHADQAAVLRITPGHRLALEIDTVSGYSDQVVTLLIHMQNRELISGFELLFHLDPTAVTVTDVGRAGTRIENWEMFAVTEDYAGHPGEIQIMARADINDGSPTAMLDPGEGPIAAVQLHLISDVNFAGLSFPARFVFHTAQANTVMDAAGETVFQDEIAYTHGAVLIRVYEDKLIGDINLNGLAFEVGDVVYFANYFSNPVLFPLSYAQRANSDVNGDGTPATIADLVYMINIVTGGAAPKAAPGGEARATWAIDDSGALWLESEQALGAVYVELRSAREPEPGPALAGMTVKSGHEGGLRRLVIYSMAGAAVATDAGPLLLGLGGAEIVAIRASDATGFAVDLAPRAVRPERATLLGNYPNPFNPTTSIRFALADPGDVKIEIYNLLGLRVRSLGGRFPAGEHDLVWDGRDRSGRPVASGVYFYRFSHAGNQHVRRMLLLK
jgi:hypothetical protein